MKGIIKKTLGLTALGLTVALSSPLYASGYRLEFQSPSVLADGGDAAVVEDAGTNWYNSAGLVYVPQQLTASVIDIYERTTFKGTEIAPSIIIPGDTFVASGRATSDSNIGLPALHYSIPFYDRFAFGLSIVPAWGLLENYGNNASLVRYDLIKIYTRTIDIAPSLAIKLNDQWSIGFGPDIHYWYLSSKTAVRTEPFTDGDSLSRFSTNDWSYGAHAGVLFRLSDATRFGLNHRTKIVMDMKGYSQFALTGIESFETHQFEVNIALPPTTSFSAYHEVTPQWALMGTITYDQWSVLRDLHGFNFIGPTGALTTIVVPQDLRNTFDFSAGTHYKFNDQWMLRGSLKYEQTPTTDAYRDLNFPDAEKLGINIGARYQMTKRLALDLIYAHVYTWNVPINNVNAFHATTKGQIDTEIDLAGAQLVWDIC